MPTPAHTRVTISGLIGPSAAPVEEWSIRFNCIRNVTHNDFQGAQMNALADGVRSAYVTHLAPRFRSDMPATKFRVALINDLGRTELRADGSFKQGLNEVAAAGTIGAATGLPASTAVVCSFNTARAGASGKGRVFLPGVHGVLADTKLYDAADTQATATAMKNFLGALNAAVGGLPVVASSKGFLTPIISVRVGRRPDVLRSRSRSQAEQYGVNVPL